MPLLPPERWRILSRYLDEALEVAAPRRAEWLASISARNAVLGRELQMLLDEYDAVHESGFLEQPLPLPRRTALE
jgi:hypothetical protein